jgi:hypothetical protein
METTIVIGLILTAVSAMLNLHAYISRGNMRNYAVAVLSIGVYWLLLASAL